MLNINYAVLYYAAAGLVLYTIIYTMLYAKGLIKNSSGQRRIIRRFFFCIWFLLFAFFFNTIPIDKLKLPPANILGIHPEMWLFLTSFAGFMGLGFIIDVFIISTYEIKSVGKDGITLADENAVLDQAKVVVAYERKVEAEREIIKTLEARIREYKEQVTAFMSDTGGSGVFDPIELLYQIIQSFLDLQNYQIKSSVLFHDELEDININYSLTPPNRRELAKALSDNEPCLLNDVANHINILCFNYYYNNIGEDMIIVLESRNELTKKDALFAYNILQVFEIVLADVINEVIEEMEIGTD